MAGRTPREMLASIVRRLAVPAGTGEILEALNFANQHLASYYSWPWFLSEMTWTFRAPVTGTCTMNSAGQVIFDTYSDVDYGLYVDQNWRIQIGLYDYPVLSVGDGCHVAVDITKIRPIEVTTAANFTLFHAGLTMPADFMPGKDIACYNTTMRYRVRHVNRMAFERHWQSYKQMTSNIPLLYADREPFYDAVIGWRYQLQFCPRPAGNTQIRIAYYRRPSPVNLTTNLPLEWPEGFDEVIELIATGRLGEALGDPKAVGGARRAKGLIRQLRGSVATAVMDETPMQNAPFGGAAWEEDGLSVLPREV